MKRFYITSVFLMASVILVLSNDYTVMITGYSYSPLTLTVVNGDHVTIEASSMHPLVQVDKSTWESNGTTPLAGGWGSKTSNYTFTAAPADTIYYVCSNHVASHGMKGKIIIQQATGIINEASDMQGFTIYPNPADSKISLHLNIPASPELTLSIFNINGELVKILSPSNLSFGTYDYPADVSDIQNGIYFFVIRNKEKQYSRKFIIAR
jgi:plastocyanin